MSNQSQKTVIAVDRATLARVNMVKSNLQVLRDGEHVTQAQAINYLIDAFERAIKNGTLEPVNAR